MALCFSLTTVHLRLHQHQHHQTLPPNIRATISRSAAPPSPFLNQNFPSTIHPHRSSPLFASNSNSCSGRCRAASPGRPPPQESDPPTGDDSNSSAGPTATFSSLQDSVQIFFAVLFWMSLFFWSSAWDGRNNGRPSKGSRFRR